MKRNKKAFSLIIAMWLVLITSLLAFTMLEYMIPFSKNIKWVENSTKAYYQANNWIETWLYFFSTRTNLTDESNKNHVKNIDYKVNTISSGSILPKSWYWNSEYNSDWNIVNLTNPIQLSIWNWYITNILQLKIDFRVPNLDKLPSAETLSWASMPIINWQLSSPNNTLNSNSWSTIKVSDICESDESCTTWINLYNLQWVQLDWLTKTIQDFYSEQSCNTWTNKCVLKFSIINDLKTTSWVIIPYLEWKIRTSWERIPLRYSVIESEWKSTWFVKKLEVNVPQETVSEAFDFTVFQ